MVTKILKKIHYVYLLIAIVFIVDGFTRLQYKEPHPWLSFLLAAAAVGMFFFRKKFSKKFDDHNKKQ